MRQNLKEINYQLTDVVVLLRGGSLSGKKTRQWRLERCETESLREPYQIFAPMTTTNEISFEINITKMLS